MAHPTDAIALKLLKLQILSILAATLIRVLRFTWRVHIEFAAPIPSNTRVVFCFWHGNQAGLFAYPTQKPVTVLSSLSQDGTLQALILRRLGFVVCRGSSTRGGAGGLKSVIRHLKMGHDAAFAVDGPRGPIHRAKIGALKAARLSDALIVPIAASANRSWIFQRAWDRYTLPGPFASVRIRVGAPVSATGLTTETVSAMIDRLHEAEKAN